MIVRADETHVRYSSQYSQYQTITSEYFAT